MFPAGTPVFGNARDGGVVGGAVGVAVGGVEGGVVGGVSKVFVAVMVRTGTSPPAGSTPAITAVAGESWSSTAESAPPVSGSAP
jgi:hypothetical protein